MSKKQKENIKSMVSYGLSIILTKLKIVKPSSKTERTMKKYGKKLTDQLKIEMKKQGIKRAKSKAGKTNSQKPRVSDN